MLFQGYWHEVKCKQPCPGFELSLPNPLLIITITPHVPLKLVNSSTMKKFYQISSDIIERKEKMNSHVNS